MKILAEEFKDLGAILEEINTKGYEELVREIVEKDKELNTEFEPTEEDDMQLKAYRVPGNKKEKNNSDKGVILSNILELTSLLIEWDKNSLEKE